MSERDCIFCRIISGELSADYIYQDERAVAIRDINPQAPTHVLVMPRQHIASLADMTEEQAPFLGHLALVANQVAKLEGIDATGYRVITNVGPDSGQAVRHLHFHVLGGRHLGRLVSQ